MQGFARRDPCALVDRLLQRLLEAAAAQTSARGAALLLVHEGRLVVAAKAARAADGGLAVTVHDPPRQPSPKLTAPEVMNAREALVIGESLLCVPVLVDGELRGALCLESDLTFGVPAADRRPALDVLAAQAAMAVEYVELRRAIAERVRTLHTERMDAVAKLAGRVAHDFNNVLAIVGLYSTAALEVVGEDDAVRDDLERIRRAVQQGEALTEQLSSFSRHRKLAPRPLELDRVVANLAPTVRDVAGEAVELRVEVEAGCTIEADPRELEQLVVNLVTNARDAMPEGGRLTVRTAADADHVRLTVADTGHGMDAETQARMFEPFFTTRPARERTGLGLATVYGFVLRSGGDIGVHSAPLRGTEITVSFPRAKAP